MEVFQEIGAFVSQRWKASNYNERTFPAIASEALELWPPHRSATVWDVVKWAGVADVLPRQDDLEAKFGNPPLTIYYGRGFSIQVLFWLHGVPSVHQHGFSGAFHVMLGSSIHSKWAFEATETIETRLVLGDVTFRDAEILRAGDSRPILAGAQMYHATFHLERPSVSVVVRTTREEDKEPQYRLLPPSVAWADQSTIPTVTRQLQVLEMLLNCGRRADFIELCLHILATKDAYTMFRILHSTLHRVEDEQEQHDLISAARRRHPRIIDPILRAIELEVVGRRIIALNKAIENEELKFFLALLRNIPTSIAIRQLTAERYPSHDVIAKIIGWIRELSNTGALGFRIQETWLIAIELLLRGTAEPEVRARLARHCETHGMHGNDADIKRLIKALKESWLFAPLLCEHDSELSVPCDRTVADTTSEFDVPRNRRA
jgi:hypothetical protein